MKKILVPVDFSSHTDITCRYAIEFARAYGAEIKLFHTYFDQIFVADTSFPDTLDMSTIYNEELMKEIFRHAERNMDELEEKVGQLILKENLSNIIISSTVTGGEFEQELKAICIDFHPDLVVMGTTGKGRNLKTWGKVSSFIIDHAKVPVITIPEIKNFRGFGNIMFAADLSEGNTDTISGLIRLFSVFNTRIHVVHFITRGKETNPFGKMKELKMKFGKEETSNQLTFEVIEVAEDNQAAVDQCVAAKEIDMIAFNPHKRNLLYMLFTKNITKKNLFATNVPLLSLPAHN